MKKILIILTALLSVFALTSFTHIKTEVYLLPMNPSEGVTELDPIEYIPCGEKLIDAPYIDQRSQYPNGCEAVSTVMALNYLGIEISADEFIDKHLDMGDAPVLKENRGDDPDHVFCGDPRSDTGWGCNSSVIVNALNKFIDTDEFVIEHGYGRHLTDLCYDYIDRDIPVIIWVTVDMEDSSSEENWHSWVTEEGKEIRYNRLLHCMLLCGYDEANYYFNDPLTCKLMAYPKAETEKAYSILGMQSIAIK